MLSQRKSQDKEEEESVMDLWCEQSPSQGISSVEIYSL